MSRPIYSISVSKVDAFDKWINRQNEDNELYNNEANFLSTLRGEFKQLPSAKYGECFHAIIEGTANRTEFIIPVTNEDKLQGAKDQLILGYQYKEIFIPDSEAKCALAYREEHAMGTAEVSARKIYHTPNFDLVVTGKVDRLIGNWIRDTKTKYGQIDIQEDYIDSLQWKFYLDMFGLDTFWYDIFTVKGFNEVKDCLTAKINPLEPMMLKRYPGLDYDCQYAVNELAKYLEYKNLLQYVEISPISTIARELKLFTDMVWNGDTLVTWGKHRGKLLRDVPDSWLAWTYENSVLPKAFKVYIEERVVNNG